MRTCVWRCLPRVRSQNYESCYGHVDVFEDRLELRIMGDEAAARVPRTLPLPPPPPTLLTCVLEAVP